VDIIGTLDLTGCTSLIEAYFGDNGGAYNVKLPNSIKELNYKSYGTCVLSDNTHLSLLNLRFCTRSFWNNMPDGLRIDSLDIFGSAGFDISVLNGLEKNDNFTTLSIRCDSSYDTPAVLEGCDALNGTFNVTNLTVQYTDSFDCSLFSHFPNLKKLVIAECDSLTSLTNLEQCEFLTSIQATKCNISSISGLSSCTGLTNLYLWGNNISDLSFLNGLENLTELRLYENKINDISAISNLKNLTTLELYSNNIEDISPLEGTITYTRRK
jgi:Leucine-rich repeat (LRR) protein